jgi:hypothetical protein
MDELYTWLVRLSNNELEYLFITCEHDDSRLHLHFAREGRNDLIHAIAFHHHRMYVTPCLRNQSFRRYTAISARILGYECLE